MDIDRLLSEGETVLEKAKDAADGESLTLDFKTNGQRDDALFANGAITARGREIIAKALSAFSNSAGGHVVVGVDCRKVDGVDRISELRPLRDVAACASSLNGTVGELVQPRLDGVRVNPIFSQAEDSTGYLVVDIPRSNRRPHMSQVDHRYYKRSGSSTFTMEHYDVEDAFHRQDSPILNLSWRLSAGLRTNEFATFKIELFIANEGHKTARHPEFAVRARRGFLVAVPTVYAPKELRVREVDGRAVISGTEGLVINPGATVSFNYFEFNMKTIGGMIVVGDLDWNQAKVEIDYELRAEDTAPVIGTISIDRHDLADFRHNVPGYRGT